MPARQRRPGTRSRWFSRLDDSAVSPVIGTILMVAITVTLAAVVFVLVQRLSENDSEPAPAMTFTQDETDGELQVIQAPPGSEVRDWADMRVTGCTAPAGTVDAGDTLTGCSGTITIVDEQSNSVIYHGEF